MLTLHKNFKEINVCFYMYTHINLKLDLHLSLHVTHVLGTLLTHSNVLAFYFL